MNKRLQDMTLSELWELFPIDLCSHNSKWKQWADDEIGRLSRVLRTFNPIINHIGSTAIPDIAAKPIIDILVEIADEADFDEIRHLLEDKGYICMSESSNRMSFNKGYTPDGYAGKVYHIHVHRTGDNDEIAFRDYLIEHPDAAREYEQLKQSLLPAYRHDRDGYTAAKTEFVKRIIDNSKNTEKMMHEVNPADTSRAYAFEMWMNAPMPMVTLIRTLDVSRLIYISRKRELKFNMLMCWCVGKAASQIKEFYMLPVGDKLIRYLSLAVNTIVADTRGEVSSCDIPFSHDISRFNADYLRLTRQVAGTCTNHDITDRMVIGTSALAHSRIDGAVGMYSGIFNNPFMIWGSYRRQWFKTLLTVSFQFHHTQMDGAHAAHFLDLLQNEIKSLGRG